MTSAIIDKSNIENAASTRIFQLLEDLKHEKNYIIIEMISMQMVQLRKILNMCSINPQSITLSLDDITLLWPINVPSLEESTENK